MGNGQIEGPAAALAAAMPAAGRLIGLDLGSKTIGIALSDTRQTVASPLETLQRQKFAADADRLVRVISQHGVTGIVLGLPLNMDGSEGPSAQSARAFGRNFSARCSLPFGFWDERLSTEAVTRTMLEADLSRARRGQIVDKMAAAFILQGALDALREARAANHQQD